MFNKKLCSKKFAIFTGKTAALESLFNKVADLKDYLKKTPTQVFFCEYCKIFKNTYLKKYLRTAAFALK